MNDRPTLDEFFPTLRDIENAPPDLCKAAYDRLDTDWRGEIMDCFYKMAADVKSTRKILERMWPTMEIEKQKPVYFKMLIYGLEHMVRLTAGTVPEN